MEIPGLFIVYFRSFQTVFKIKTVDFSTHFNSDRRISRQQADHSTNTTGAKSGLIFILTNTIQASKSTKYLPNYHLGKHLFGGHMSTSFEGSQNSLNTAGSFRFVRVYISSMQYWTSFLDVFCHQMRGCLKVLVIHFLTKEAQIFPNFWAILKYDTLKEKYSFFYFWDNYWKNWATFNSNSWSH